MRRVIKALRLLFLTVIAVSVCTVSIAFAAAWRVGDRVEAGFLGSSSLYRVGVITEVGEGRYRVHFDGYTDSYDDWVQADHIRAAPAPTPAEASGPACRVGLHVPRAGLTNREAIITAVDAKQGLYRVKYDNGDPSEWLPARLIGGCTGAGPAPITERYYAGIWSLFIGPTPHYEKRGADTWIVVGSGAKAFTLAIKAGGTYQWQVDSRTVVRGNWRTMRTDEYSPSTKGPAIVLIRGDGGYDWAVARPTAVGSADTRDQIAMWNLKLGTSSDGIRLK